MKRFCPECGEPLEFSYQMADGTDVYYCPIGDEGYYFEEDNGFEYAVRVADGKMFDVGLIK